VRESKLQLPSQPGNQRHRELVRGTEGTAAGPLKSVLTAREVGMADSEIRHKTLISLRDTKSFLGRRDLVRF
jgi:hypothetical protein